MGARHGRCCQCWEKGLEVTTKDLFAGKRCCASRAMVPASLATGAQARSAGGSRKSSKIADQFRRMRNDEKCLAELVHIHLQPTKDDVRSNHRRLGQYWWWWWGSQMDGSSRRTRPEEQNTVDECIEDTTNSFKFKRCFEFFCAKHWKCDRAWGIELNMILYNALSLAK